MFSEMSKEELNDIYLDICLSEADGRRCESLVPFAEALRVKIDDLLPLRDAISMAKEKYFKEVAKRYFKS